MIVPHSIDCLKSYLTPIMNSSPSLTFAPPMLNFTQIGNMTSSPDPPTFQHATLKLVNAPGDKDIFTVHVVAG